MIDLTNKTILVTGGGGFIGSNFIEMVLKKYSYCKVINIDKRGIGSRSLIDESSNWIGTQRNNLYYEYMENLMNLDSSLSHLREWRFDYIFHFAAESHVDRSINSPEAFIENNVMGMVSLLEWVRKYQPQAKVINISTDEVFGHLNVNDPAFTEESPFNPRSPYASSKASADLIANSYVTTYGLDITTTHCCNNFGKHQADEKFIPTVIRSIVRGEPIPVYGKGENIREWIHVEDHNKWLLKVADNRYCSTNIGSGIEKTNLDMIKDIGNILGVTPNIKFVEDRKGHDFRYAIESHIPFELRNHDEALKETVEFYKNKYENQGTH
jgi:dTDP-glucose 4,6-dehydratase